MFITDEKQPQTLSRVYPIELVLCLFVWLVGLKGQESVFCLLRPGSLAVITLGSPRVCMG